METKKLYECLLLIDSALAASEWEAITGKIQTQIEKRGGEIVSLKKWDERQLAYEIQKKNRGTYILVYFKSEPGSIVAIERDFNLAEDIMRTLILRADFIASDEQMDKQAPVMTDFRQRGISHTEPQAWKDKSYSVVEDIDDDDIDDEDIEDEDESVDDDGDTKAPATSEPEEAVKTSE